MTFYIFYSIFIFLIRLFLTINKFLLTSSIRLCFLSFVFLFSCLLV
ncbi:unknown [Bacteroides uniformis CAG:3]|nr:unknown [Bacteroides uniformis CAG:3]